MEVKEIERLIHFHQDGLDQYRQHMSPAAQHLEEQTIKALEELKKRIEDAEQSSQDALVQTRKLLAGRALHGD